MPPLPWLRALAAGELNLTQAAVSKQVKLLGHYLREPLFERLPVLLAAHPHMQVRVDLSVRAEGYEAEIFELDIR